jgi:hypothetical protein
MRYEIDELNVVRLFNDQDEMPFQIQPSYPNGDTFDTAAEAEIWAILAIAAFEPNQPFAPNGKGLQGEPKPDYLSAQFNAALTK